MKVILCSPYLSNDGIHKGGINTWGRYIVTYYDRLSDPNLRLFPVSFDRSSSTTTNKGVISRLFSGLKEYRTPVKRALRIIKEVHPDVLHLCTSAGYGLFRDIYLLSVAHKYKVKTVVHFHFGRIPELASANNWEWKLIKKVVERANIAIVMNRPSEECLKKAGFSNIEYLPNPIGDEVLERIYSANRKDERVARRLLYAGHVIKTKGVYELVEACVSIPNIELRLAGKCSSAMKDDLEVIAKRANQGNWLKILGELNHDEVIDELLQADVFIFPSYTEGFPNVILEAMACGCPIVSTNVGAIPEMLNVNSEPCGYCINPMQVDEIISAVQSLLNDESLKKEFSALAYKRINAEYTMPKVWQQLVKMWRM